MTTTVEALKEIYVSLGGELTDTYDDIAGGIAVGDYVTIPDVSNAIAQRAASAGIELPSVTSSDNGKVLSVVSGKWNKADAPKELPTVTASDNGDVLTVVEGAWAKAASGSERVIFEAELNMTNFGESTTTATSDEIKEAIDNGKVPMFIAKNKGAFASDQGGKWFTLGAYIYNTNSGSISADFYCLYPSTNTCSILKIAFYKSGSTDNVTFTRYDYPKYTPST